MSRVERKWMDPISIFCYEKIQNVLDIRNPHIILVNELRNAKGYYTNQFNGFERMKKNMMYLSIELLNCRLCFPVFGC